jgi:hypothetical protein
VVDTLGNAVCLVLTGGQQTDHHWLLILRSEVQQNPRKLLANKVLTPSPFAMPRPSFHLKPAG